MLKTLLTGQAQFGIILEKICYALDKLDRDGAIEEGVDIPRRDLYGIPSQVDQGTMYPDYVCAPLETKTLLVAPS